MKFLLQEMRLTVLVLFVNCVVPVGTTTVDDVKRLLDRANSSNYDKRIRPLKNQTNALEVKLGLILYSVIDFDQPKEALLTSVQLLVHWKDELLAWEKDDYGGIEGLLFALESQCSVNTKRFPYDTQTCSLFFESACYPATQLKLFRDEDGVQLSYYQHNSAWDLKSTSTVYHEPEAVEFKLVLKRRCSYYIIHIFLPITFISFLGPFAFMLPANSGERSGFAIGLFLTFGVCLTSVASELPKNSEEIPHLSIYIVTMSLVNGMVVGICLVQIRLAKRKNKEGEEPKDPPGSKTMRIYKKAQQFRREKALSNPSWLDIMTAVDVVLFWFVMGITVLCTGIAFGMARNG